jgi:hypothetical protein
LRGLYLFRRACSVCCCRCVFQNALVMRDMDTANHNIVMHELNKQIF